jgi:hypothetical protein
MRQSWEPGQASPHHLMTKEIQSLDSESRTGLWRKT